MNLIPRVLNGVRGSRTADENTQNNMHPSPPSNTVAVSDKRSKMGSGDRKVVACSSYRTYAQRWMVLFAVCLLGFSSCAIWIAFAPIDKAATAFYCPPISRNRTENGTGDSTTQPQQCDVVYWSSQIFQIVGFATGLFGMYITDRHGIRLSCHMGAFLNLIGASIRTVSSMPESGVMSLSPRYRLPIFYTGQSIAAMAQPFFLVLSPKVAEHWFVDDQRALANSLGFIAQPIGMVVASLIPLILTASQSATTDEQPNDDANKQRLSAAEHIVSVLNVSLFVTAIAAALASLGVTRSRPPTMPSASSESRITPNFVDNLIALAKMPTFYVQTVAFGVAFSFPWPIFILTDKMMSTLGYADKILGYLLPLSALAGTLVAVVAGHIIDRTRRFKELIKLFFIGIAISAIALNIHLRHPKQQEQVDAGVLIVLIVALGALCIAIFPVCLELAVETTFPVAEATPSGLMIIAGQLMCFLLMFAMQSLESVNWLYKKPPEGSNYQLSIDFWTLVGVLSAVFVCISPDTVRKKCYNSRQQFSNNNESSTINFYASKQNIFPIRAWS